MSCLTREWLVALLSLPVTAWGQASLPRPLIAGPTDESNRIQLNTGIHPYATPAFDRGLAPATLPMERMLLVLRRSAEQETALDDFLQRQLEPSSPDYHRWLTPEEFGRRFGPAESDIRSVTEWLASHGFRDFHTASGRMAIEFSGTAGNVLSAFRTPIHKYSVRGRQYWANSGDQQIPAALAPVVVGVSTLHNFPLRDPDVAQFDGASGCNLGNSSCHWVGPYDFALLYNTLPLWDAGIDGSGQSIAILAESNFNLQDVRNFRAVFGLPPNDPEIVLNGRDPGVVRAGGDEAETLGDAMWAGAVAKGANIKVVISASTNSTLGYQLSAQYAVDRNLAPIVSASIGACELWLGTATNQFWRQLWQQAAAQGITAIVSSGDGGASGCDNFLATRPAPAKYGLAVNGFASTPYNIAVGATDFYAGGHPEDYWNPSNDSNLITVKGYIPETTWNDSCASTFLKSPAGYSEDAQANCNNPLLSRYVGPLGSGGGASACTISDGHDPGSCRGGYAKPYWQLAPGVPNDGRRDLPDVSLSAGGDLSANLYAACKAEDGVPCSLEDSRVGGATGATSLTAQLFAGIMAMAVQNSGSWQGNANAVLYKLAASQHPEDCNASEIPAAYCIFHDVTSGTNAMPCAKNSRNCLTANSRNQYGMLSGYPAQPGYDLATGLGSVDAFNLVTAGGWRSDAAVTSEIDAEGVLNAASYARGAPVAPGSLAAVFGSFALDSATIAPALPMPPILSGLTLKAGKGYPVPMIFVSPTQVNIQVPWELEGEEAASLTAVIGGRAGAAVPLPLTAFAPGIFTVTGTGSGQGTILDLANHIVDASNPAHPGNILQIFCTGLGAVSNRPPSGQAALASPPSETLSTPAVTIGNVAAEVLFSGLTPGQVGLYQVNVRMSPSTPKSSNVPVVLSIGGVSSNVVSITVR